MDKQELHILTVADSPKVRETIRKFLRDDPAHEYNFLQADTGKKGLELCRSETVDCIMLDFELPDMGGLEFISAFSGDHKQVPAAVIILVGQENEDRAVKAMEAGASDYLIKGRLTADLLIRAVRYSVDRKQAKEALNSEREKFRVLVEDAPFGISIIGKDGDGKYANPKFVDIFGYTLEDIPTARAWFEKAFPDGEYRSQVISTWTNALKESKRGRFSPKIFTVTCKDGAKKVIQFLPAMIETGDHFVIYQDISEKEKLEAQLIQAQKMEAIGTLAGGIAHDFNNLLTTIIGNSYLMLLDLREEDPLKEGMEEIKRAGESAASLTRQLLAFSRKQILRPELLNLNEVITGISKMVGRLIGENVRVETALKTDLMKVKADPGQMEQVILNLAVNARDAMPQGGALIVETSNVYLDDTYGRDHGMTHKPGHYVMLAMSDTGIGMDRETLDKIFEPFFTTKERDKGTGLGLSTVYGIVKQSDGYIWVYSEPGKGTTFKVYLPAEEQKAASVRGESSSLEGLSGAETVLLVEDDGSLRSLAQKTLNHYGYSVLEAGNGEDALRLSKTHKGTIHLMVTDVVMPGMSGSELAKRMMPLFSDMKVIYMSGYTDDAIAHHGVLESNVDFIEKPFTPESFVRKIREVLGMQ